MIGLIVAWLVTAVSLFIIAQLPTGVEIDSFGKALWSSLIFGVLNALIRPVLKTLTLPVGWLFSHFFVFLVINFIIFGLAAMLVTGFRLRWGFWSALIGSFALSFLNSLVYQFLPV